MESVLIVLNDGCDGVEDIFALRVLLDFLEIEVLDRDVIVAELEVAAHGFEVGLLHLFAPLVLLGKVPFDRGDGTVDQRRRVVALGAVVRGP